MNWRTKCIATIGMFLLVLSSYAQHEHTLQWNTNIDKAKAIAKEQGKPVLISFSGSDWCANCMRLYKDLFESDSFAHYAMDNLVLLNLDFPAKKKNKLPEEEAKKNQELFDQYNKVKSFPAVVLIDAEGKIIGQMKYPLEKPEQYIANIKSIVSQ